MFMAWARPCKWHSSRDRALGDIGAEEPARVIEAIVRVQHPGSACEGSAATLWSKRTMAKGRQPSRPLNFNSRRDNIRGTTPLTATTGCTTFLLDSQRLPVSVASFHAFGLQWGSLVGSLAEIDEYQRVRGHQTVALRGMPLAPHSSQLSPNSVTSRSS